MRHSTIPILAAIFAAVAEQTVSKFKIEFRIAILSKSVVIIIYIISEVLILFCIEDFLCLVW